MGLSNSNELIDDFRAIPQLTCRDDFNLWDAHLDLALRITGTRKYLHDELPSLPATQTPEATRDYAEWAACDGQVAALILTTCSDTALGLTRHLLDGDHKTVPGAARRVYDELVKRYKPLRAFECLELGSRFMYGTKCQDSVEGVRLYVAEMASLAARLKKLEFDENDYMITVALNTMPSRFHQYTSQILASAPRLTLEDVLEAVKSLNEGRGVPFKMENGETLMGMWGEA